MDLTKQIKPNYLIIPLITLITAWSGSLVTKSGMVWYESISKPAWTPAGAVIGSVWTIIFILATISALIFWNREKSFRKKILIGGVFLANAFLNFLWSYLFFGLNFLDWPVLEAIILGMSVLLLMFLLCGKHKVSSFLLLPYLLWVSFASFLTYAVWLANQTF